jgi:hypothetical protein
VDRGGLGEEGGEPDGVLWVRDVECPGGDASHLGVTVGVPRGVESPGDEGGSAWVEDLDAVEEDEGGDPGVAVIRDGERVLSVEEDTGSDRGLEEVWDLPLEGDVAEWRGVEGEAEVVLACDAGVGATLEMDADGGAACGIDALE